MERRRGYAGLVKQAHRRRGDQWGLLGGLGDDRVAGRERSHHLAAEDCKREIPRTDADEDAAAAVMQLIALAGRARQQLGRQASARSVRIVAAEVRRLAHFGKRVVKRLAAFRLKQRNQRTAPLLQKIGGTVERRGARLNRRRIPSRKAGL